MSAHDRWLANYHRSLEQVWCENPECDHHTDPLTVECETEYGASTINPEECPLCNGWLTFDRPSEDTGDDLSDEDAETEA